MTIDLSTIEFHDAPPPKISGGRTLDPAMQQFLDVLKQNPGKWAKYPERLGSGRAKTLRKHGVLVECRNNDAKTKACDLWLCWPAKPAAKTLEKGQSVTVTVPVKVTEIRQHPPVKGKVVRCDDCDWETGTDHVADLDKHCRLVHNRPSSKVERMPVNAGAAA